MSASDIAILLVCAALGFGITLNVMGSFKTTPRDDKGGGFDDARADGSTADTRHGNER